MVGHPVQCGGGHDRVDGLVELELECVLAPHPGAIAEPLAREGDHVRGGVQGQHAAAGDEGQQRLGHPPGAAADVEHRRVRCDPLEAGEHVGGPLLLGSAGLVVSAGVPEGGHDAVRLLAGGTGARRVARLLQR